MSDLRETLHDALDDLDVPPGDLRRVHADGARLRRRRRASAAVGTGVVGALVVVLVTSLGGLTGDAGRPDTAIDPAGVVPGEPLDLDGGLRGYVSGDGSEVHLGGRVLDGDDVDALAPSAAATALGLVHYEDGVPLLLDASGGSRAIEPGAEPGGSYTPTVQVDADGTTVAYGAVLDGLPTVVVRDLVSDTVVATRQVTEDTFVRALDDGVLVLGDDAGSVAWDTATEEEQVLAGPGTRVVDLREGVLLFDGARPEGPAATGLRLVRGPTDATLTLDGEHVLAWASTLRPTRPGGAPVVLAQGPPDGGYAFWALDTDGSVLVAVPGSRVRAAVWDCPLDGGPCEALAPLSLRGGDPHFVGGDL